LAANAFAFIIAFTVPPTANAPRPPLSLTLTSVLVVVTALRLNVLLVVSIVSTLPLAVVSRLLNLLAALVWSMVSLMSLVSLVEVTEDIVLTFARIAAIKSISDHLSARGDVARLISIFVLASRIADLVLSSSESGATYRNSFSSFSFFFFLLRLMQHTQQQHIMNATTTNAKKA
jgi:hypothetical protein